MIVHDYYWSLIFFFWVIFIFYFHLLNLSLSAPFNIFIYREPTRFFIFCLCPFYCWLFSYSSYFPFITLFFCSSTIYLFSILWKVALLTLHFSLTFEHNLISWPPTFVKLYPLYLRYLRYKLYPRYPMFSRYLRYLLYRCLTGAAYQLKRSTN